MRGRPTGERAGTATQLPAPLGLYDAGRREVVGDRRGRQKRDHLAFAQRLLEQDPRSHHAVYSQTESDSTTQAAEGVATRLTPSFVAQHQEMPMYTPKIRADLIPRLYRAAKARKIPMTRLVSEIVAAALAHCERETAASRTHEFSTPPGSTIQRKE